MSLRIITVGIVVRDQERALDFFTNKVGFEKKMDYSSPNGYRHLTVAPKGQDLQIALGQVGAPDPNGWSRDWRPGCGLPIVMVVDDCRGAFAEMKSRGVEFKQAQPDENPWGISATFSDPDGNLFSINQFPGRSTQ